MVPVEIAWLGVIYAILSTHTLLGFVEKLASRRTGAPTRLWSPSLFICWVVASATIAVVALCTAPTSAAWAI